jgi:hypothetical protein
MSNSFYTHQLHPKDHIFLQLLQYHLSLLLILTEELVLVYMIFLPIVKKDFEEFEKRLALLLFLSAYYEYIFPILVSHVLRITIFCHLK